MPKGNKIEDFVDIKAGNILSRSDSFRFRMLVCSVDGNNCIFKRIGPHSVNTFYRRVEQLGRDKFPQFSQYGKMTFFIPVDSAFRVRSVCQ